MTAPRKPRTWHLINYKDKPSKVCPCFMHEIEAAIEVTKYVDPARMEVIKVVEQLPKKRAKR